MEIFVIDDNERFATALQNRCASGNEQKYIPLKMSEFESVHKLSNEIAESLQSGTVLFININLTVKNKKRLNYAGIELLTWLRIKGIKNHCVLYSYESSDTIAKRTPKNSLMFSKGNTFVQLPNDFSNFDFRQIKDDVINKENLKLYLKSLFDVSAFRHRNANWWSVKVLWDIHRVATKGNFNEDYPQAVKDNLSILNNSVGVFLNELEVINISKFIENPLNKIRNKKKDLEEQLTHIQNDTNQDFAEYYNDEFSKIEEELTQLNKDIQYLVGEEDYKNHLAHRAKLQVDRNFVSTGLTIIETAKPILDKIADEIKYQEKSLQNIYACIEKKLFGDINKPSANTTANILLIDDNAENGWSSIFGHIFQNANIQSVVPRKEYKNRIDQLFSYFIKPVIKAMNGNTTLICLDLRLFDESERRIDVENLSGKLMLEKIRGEFKGIPIIITTASNKVWTFQQLVKAGADAYWVKEGFDEQREAKNSVNNYIRLLELVVKMTDGRYQLLKEFADYAKQFEKGKNKHWSKNVIWKNGDNPPGDVNAVSKTLKDSVSVLRNYLHNYHLGYGYDDDLNESFILSSLINKIGGVYENIHRIDSKFGVPPNFFMRRGDSHQTPLRDLRNDASHNKYHLIKWDDLEKCIYETMNYLDTKQEN